MVEQVGWIVHSIGVMDQYRVELSKIHNFARTILAGYKDENPYHNGRHGMEVMQMSAHVYHKIEAFRYLSRLNVFSAIVSALAHDVGHPGVNNMFLVKTKDKLVGTSTYFWFRGTLT